jgi:signal peptidase II
LVDLVTKHYVFQWLGMPAPNAVWWVWDGVFGFQTSLNEGALFGLGQGFTSLFVGLSLVAACGIVIWLFVAKAAQDLLLTVALGCVTAGIFGNLYDRLGMHGLTWHVASPAHAVGDPVYAVRDWILVMIVKYPWPNFNVADSLLVCGAGLLVWHALAAENRAGRPGDGKSTREPAARTTDS